MKLKEVAKRCKMCWCVLSEPFDSPRCASCDKLKFINTPPEARMLQKNGVVSPNLIIRNLPNSNPDLRWDHG